MQRTTALIEPISIRLRISGEMIDQIDQMATKAPEATRSSMIRTVLRKGIPLVIEEMKNAELRS